MTLKEQVLAQALLLTGELGEQQMAMLTVLCDGAVGMLTARLRDGFTPEDCRAEFVAAASLMALAELGCAADVEEFQAGDLTVKRGADTASQCLRRQGEWILAPYLKDRFSFTGV